MAYNPNPPYNPSDYGTHGRIDYERMEKSLQDHPVCGEGAPVRESVMKDPSEYSSYTGEPPKFFTDRQADFKASIDKFNEALYTKPKQEKEKTKETKEAKEAK